MFMLTAHRQSLRRGGTLQAECGGRQWTVLHGGHFLFHTPGEGERQCHIFLVLPLQPSFPGE